VYLAAALEPEEGADSALSFELDHQSAAGHDAALPAPTGLMVEVCAIHVKAAADLFDLPLVSRFPFRNDLE
jgi:hypothetical protein